eukprot:TRINITY_DN3485_c0_g1_i3.p1 TRINITY_DN3485_c0_g1~~TRINITY_DN3485_c0_g1_i3.p1  ORF type:complete len:227 (-),score=45.34 TRINITY_DN3485_c0_g1_i3:542-1222(-)
MRLASLEHRQGLLAPRLCGSGGRGTPETAVVHGGAEHDCPRGCRGAAGGEAERLRAATATPARATRGREVSGLHRAPPASVLVNIVAPGPRVPPRHLLAAPPVPEPAPAPALAPAPAPVSAPPLRRVHGRRLGLKTAAGFVLSLVVAVMEPGTRIPALLALAPAPAPALAPAQDLEEAGAAPAAAAGDPEDAAAAAAARRREKNRLKKAKRKLRRRNAQQQQAPHG